MKTQLALVMVGAAAAAALAGPANITITQNKDLKWFPIDPKDTSGKGPQIAFIVGDPKTKGPVEFILKTPPGFKPGPHTHTSDDYAVILQGTVHNFKAPGTDEGPGVTVGGTWFQPGGQPHDNDCEASSKDGCQFLVYMPKGFDFIPWADPAAKKK